MLRLSRLSRNIAALVCAASTVLGTSACGTSISVVTNGLAQGPTIAIGVAADQPGLGFLHGGEYSGFDISVAQYVANTLGFAKKQIVFKQVLPSARVSSLEDGTVDMVVDAFAADDVQDGEAELAGPYLTVHAALLVRSDSAGTITGTDDLAGRTVCVARKRNTLLQRAKSCGRCDRERTRHVSAMRNGIDDRAGGRHRGR